MYGQIVRQCQQTGWVDVSRTCNVPANSSTSDLLKFQVDFTHDTTDMTLGTYLSGLVPVKDADHGLSHSLDFVSVFAVLSPSRSVRFLTQASCPDSNRSHVFAPPLGSDKGLSTFGGSRSALMAIDDGTITFGCTYTVMLNWRNGSGATTVTHRYKDQEFDIYTGAGAGMAIMDIAVRP
jgi:hypothetical protein